MCSSPFPCLGRKYSWLSRGPLALQAICTQLETACKITLYLCKITLYLWWPPRQQIECSGRDGVQFLLLSPPCFLFCEWQIDQLVCHVPTFLGQTDTHTTPTTGQMVELRTGWTHGRDSQKRSGKREDRDHLDPLHSDLRKTKDYICRTHKHQQRCQWNIQGQDQARPTSGDISYTCQKSSTRSQDPFPRRP